MVRVVIDTNVLVSALINRGKPRRLLVYLLEKHTVILSRQILAELADVLSREKFNVRSSYTERFLESLVRKSRIIPVSARFKIIPEDPDDDVVLNTAYCGRADYIITGDKHMLTLRVFKTIEIVTGREMFE